jgi:Protein of unknown function (DUF3293)
VQSAPGDSFPSYQRTVVEIRLPGGGGLSVRSAEDADENEWPWPTAQPVHVLTAWDPGPERPGRTVNRARQVALEDDLRRLDLPFLSAVGVDPVTGRWEEGVAVRAVPEPEVLALADRYGQDAVFAWTPTEWAVVACHGGRRLVSGWSLVRTSQAEIPFRRTPGEPMR